MQGATRAPTGARCVCPLCLGRQPVTITSRLQADSYTVDGAQPSGGVDSAEMPDSCQCSPVSFSTASSPSFAADPGTPDRTLRVLPPSRYCRPPRRQNPVGRGRQKRRPLRYGEAGAASRRGVPGRDGRGVLGAASVAARPARSGPPDAWSRERTHRCVAVEAISTPVGCSAGRRAFTACGLPAGPGWNPRRSPASGGR